MSVHAPDCECDTYGCRLRRKGVQVSPSGMVKHNGKPPSRHRYNQWEKGVAGEHRPDGTFMPKLDANGSVIPIKKYSEGKFAKAESQVRQNQAARTSR